MDLKADSISDVEKNKILTLLNIDLYKLQLLLEEANSIEYNESEELKPIDLSSKQDSEVYTTIFPDEEIPFIKKQSLNQLIIVAGISLIEKACKDWFIWGLLYSPDKIYKYDDKGIKDYDIKILDIIKSESPLKIIIERITKGINFLDIESCNREYKKVYDFKIYDTKKKKYYFKKYINIRHVISHNAGVMDKKFVDGTGRPKEDIDTYIALKEENMKNFLYNINNLIQNLSKNVIKGVSQDLKRDKREV